MKKEDTMGSVKGLFYRILKPLMNQRGAIGDVETPADLAIEDKGIAGTGFKTPEDLAAAFIKEQGQRTNLEKKLGEQGSELGSTRKQAETLANALKEVLTKKEAPTKPAGPDYDTEIAGVQKEIQSLDPMADGYQKTLSDLVAKATKLAAISQHEKTLNAAGEMMKKELSDRDVKAQTKVFYDANPTFNTPEMQTRIKDYLANDKTGMSDPLVAFREIERDDARAQLKQVSEQNAEMQRALDLTKGKNETGKVIVKGQSPAAVTKPQANLSGKDLDAAMAAALVASRT
jgi:hypothetical protein